MKLLKEYSRVVVLALMVALASCSIALAVPEQREASACVLIAALLVISAITSLADRKTIREQEKKLNVALNNITHLAHHDPLTDLPNRVAFDLRLARTLERCETAGGKLAVISINLDRFKDINGLFGHAAGDALLREVAQRLPGVAEGAFLARMGGDEFAFIVDGDRLPSRADVLAERLLACARTPFVVQGQNLQVGVSIGIAMYPCDGIDQTSLLANADAALYRAKTEGRGAIRFFKAETDQPLRARRALNHDLGAALERNELVLHYQPLARIDGEIVGFEALLRWQHPTLGLIAPDTFIPMAEESGFIIPMGEWVLREACREAASWAKPLRISVNLSPAQFSQGDLVGMVHSALLESGLPASRLEMEITESLLADKRALSMTRRLKALGVHIVMDDFGTGYSSLQTLQTFPFDKLKIDRCFIGNVDTHAQSATIVRAVIGLCRELGVPVLAEGVETRTQLDFLAGEVCDEVQGYFFGRPQPIAFYAAIVNGEDIAAKDGVNEVGRRDGKDQNCFDQNGFNPNGLDHNRFGHHGLGHNGPGHNGSGRDPRAVKRRKKSAAA